MANPAGWFKHQFVKGKLSMLRVLIVEDNDTFRATFKQSLCEHFPSMVIEEAATGEVALQRVKENPPDLIFTDIRLPEMNGLALTKRIKTDFPNVHIAVVTGYDLPEYREAALQYGAERFFFKSSMQWDEVVAFIKSVPVRG